MYTLTPLPYAYDSLEPYIDARTMEIHHTKHQQAYIDKLNAAIVQFPELYHVPLAALLADPEKIPAAIRQDVINNGGGEFNHALFWLMMTSPAENRTENKIRPHGLLNKAIDQTFGSFDEFKKLFSQAARDRFGSGWAWLSMTRAGKLEITSTSNQDNPLSQHMMPLLGIDVWEHAYYLKYQNRRVDYIDAWWNVVNWEFIEERFKAL